MPPRARFLVFLALVFMWLAPLPASAQRVNTGAAATTSIAGCNGAPLPACYAGFLTNTFSNNANFNCTTVDCSRTGGATFQFFPGTNTNTSFNADGSVTVTSGTPDGNSNALGTFGIGHGRAFGGGYYLEFEAKFNPALGNIAYNWPALWAYDYEHAQGTDQWAGQPAGYTNFVEPDLFELYIASYFAGETAIRDTHNWYGVYNVTCSQFCNSQAQITEVIQSDLQYHKYGELWVVATATTQGYRIFFTDGIQVGAPLYWHKYNPLVDTPPAVYPSAGFSAVRDIHHYIPFITGGTINGASITVRSENVWQANTANDIIQ